MNMENFDGAPRRVREKNVYLLHLDAPRIIIIATVIIGAVVGSFLLGMHFIKENDVSDLSFAKNDLMLDEHKDLGTVSNRINDFTEGESQQKNIEEKTETPLESETITDNREPESTYDTVDPANRIETKKKTASVKVHKKSPAKLVAMHEKKPAKKISKKSRERIKTRQPVNEAPREAREEKSGGETSVVEVSSGRLDSQKKMSNFYAIQIASYDSKPKAEHELGVLKAKKIDAYVDTTNINGKSYFRLRIGPFRTLRSAAVQLNEVQTMPRYEESYLVKEK